MIGTKLANRYDIRRELGRGGMGVVYLAHDPLLDREVAVKVITPALMSTEAEQRFRREARVIARMDHPAVVVVYDIGEQDGSLYFVMPFVSGVSLRALIQDGSLRLGELLEIGIQVADALDYSHSQGVIHRDIKPENILVARDTATGLRVRITDFGLAMASSEHRLTRSGSVVGTIGYLSPEQVSAREIGYQSDIYSLGTVFYECLCGETPFSGEVQSILYRIAHEIPQSLRSRGVNIPESLDQTVLRCLEKEPSRRFEKAKALSTELTHLKQETTDENRNRPLQEFRSDPRTLSYDRPRMPALVGREREFQELQRKLNAALQGECQFVVLTGEAGIGKTRLLEEMENLARARNFRILHGRFVELDRSFPYQGFCELFQEFFRIRAATISAPPLDFSDLLSDLIDLFPVLSEVQEIRNVSATIPLQAREIRKIEDQTVIFELLARTLARMGGGEPLMIVLEDLHSADVSVEALQYVARRLGPTPTFIGASYRNTEVDRRHAIMRLLDSFQGDRRFGFHTLDRFTLSEHRRYLEAILGTAGVDSRFAEALYDATEGNPYFTRELIQSLIDAGRIERHASGWNLLPGMAITTDQLPSTIQQTVERRIERLPERLRDILSIASVLGRTFAFVDLKALVEDTSDLEESVDRLVNTGFLEEDRRTRGDTLSFSSGVIRDVLYGYLTRRRRRSLHRKFAEHLEQRAGGKSGRADSQLVHHFAEGDVPEKVVEYGLRLAHKSLEAFGAEEAIRVARMLLEFLDREVPEQVRIEAEARELLAAAYQMSGNLESSMKEMERAVLLRESLGQDNAWLQAVTRAAETAWSGRLAAETAHWVDYGLEGARRLKDTASLGRLLSLAMTLANLRGDSQRAHRYFEETESMRTPQRTSEQGIRGGRLTVAMPHILETDDPALIHLDEEQEIYSTVFETILCRDARGNLAPGLCERWISTDGGRSFLLNIRPEAKWADGTAIQASHVKHSLERTARLARGPLPAAIAPLQGIAEFLTEREPHITGLEIPGEDALRIHLQEPLPLYPTLLTDIRTSIVRDDHGRLVGSGPFVLESSTPNKVMLSRNNAYWKGETAVLDQIEFRTGIGAAEMAQGLRQGDFDLARDLSPQDLDQILSDRTFHASIMEAPRKNVYFLLFNRFSNIGANPLMRKAMFGCIRTQDFVRRALGRLAQPAGGLFPPGILGHDAGRRQRPHMPREKVIESLQASRLYPPVRLRAAIHPLLLDRYSALSQLLFRAWTEVGIEITAANHDMKSYLDCVDKNEGVDLLISRYVADYDDPDNFTYGLFHSKMGRYRNYCSAREMDHWIEAARAESDPSIRESLYARVEAHLLDNCYLFPIFHDINYRVAHPRVRNLSLGSSPPYVNYTEITRGVEAPAIVQRTGVIHVPLAGEVQGLDPSMAFLVAQTEVIPTVFETLTREAEGARIAPWLASEFHARHGGSSYEFKLRDEIRFHDGRRMTARDVRYSFERLLQNRASASRFLLSPIRGAKDLLEGRRSDLAGFHIHSETEFTIDLEQPISFFPALLTHTPASIVPEGTDFSGRPEEWAGTGPFRIARFEPAAILELEANPHYWREGLPKCEKLIFHFAVPPAEMLEGFRSGKYTLAWDLFPAEVDALRRDTQLRAVYGEIPRLSTYYAVFHTHDGVLADENLRRKIVQSIDVEGLVRRNLGRLAVPAHTLIPPGLLGYEPQRTVWKTAAAVAVPANIELTSIVNSVYQGPYSAVASEFMLALQENGIQMRIAHQSRSEYDRALASGTVDLVLTRWVADYPDADCFAHSLLHSTEGIVGRLCGTPEIDACILQARSETNPQQRHEIYQRIEEIIREHALMLPLFHEQAYCFARPEVEGFELSYSSPLVSYEKIRVIK